MEKPEEQKEFGFTDEPEKLRQPLSSLVRDILEGKKKLPQKTADDINAELQLAAEEDKKKREKHQ